MRLQALQPGREYAAKLGVNADALLQALDGVDRDSVGPYGEEVLKAVEGLADWLHERGRVVHVRKVAAAAAILTLDRERGNADILRRMPTHDTNFGAKRAREAREELGLDEVSPIACVLTLVEERAHLPVVVGHLPDDVAGALWRNGAGTIVWVNSSQAVARQRFTVAHELGHVRCRHDNTAVDTAATISGHTHEPREVQANAFAAELLAPSAGVKTMVDREPGLEEVVRLAAHFGISTIAGFYRCSTLKLLSPLRYQQLKREIEESHDRDVWGILRPDTVRDVLSEIEESPRLPDSLAGSALAALLRGETSVDAAAEAAGHSGDRLGPAAAALSR